MNSRGINKVLIRLREETGLSGAQLGKLLGATEQMISNWENGVNVPGNETRRKLAMIYRVSPSTFISYPDIEEQASRIRENQRMAEGPFWRDAEERLKERYGSRPHPEIIRRFNEEKVLFENTGLIEHLTLAGVLTHNGIDYDTTSHELCGTLTAWLTDAFPFNPLPAHTVCPRCRRTVFYPDVRVGWDLPVTKCVCGAVTIRDGYDIPLCWLKSGHPRRENIFRISLCVDDEENLRKLIRRYYGLRWKVIEYSEISKERLLLKEILGEDDPIRELMILPPEIQPIYPQIDGVFQLPQTPETDPDITGKGYFPCTIHIRPQNQIRGLWNGYRDSVELTALQTNADLQRIKSDPGLSGERLTDIRGVLKKQSPFNTSIHTLYEHLVNDPLPDRFRRLICEKGIAATDIPITREDVYTLMTMGGKETNTFHRALADIVMDKLYWNEEWLTIMDDLRELLDIVGAPPWMAEYLESMNWPLSRAEAVEWAYHWFVRAIS